MKHCRTSCLASFRGPGGPRRGPHRTRPRFSLPQFLAQNAFGRCANIPDPGPRICPNTYGRHIQLGRFSSHTCTHSGSYPERLFTTEKTWRFLAHIPQPPTHTCIRSNISQILITHDTNDVTEFSKWRMAHDLKEGIRSGRRWEMGKGRKHHIHFCFFLV